MLVAALVLLGAGCGRAQDSTSTVGRPPATGTAPGTAPALPPSSASTLYGTIPEPRGAQVPPSEGSGASSEPGVPGGPTTTCVRGPATTALGQRGGGEITCSTIPPADGSVSSPPMTDTTIPVEPVTRLQPDATRGVLRGTVGGAACPATAEQCIDLYRLVPARVDISGPTTAAAHTAGMENLFQLLLPPGRYQVVAVPDAAGETCVPTTIDVVVGQAVDVSVDCRPAS